MRIEVIVRAGENAGCLEAIRHAIGRWREAGHRVRPRATFEPGDARRFASAARRRADLLVVAGGDGTLNEVANGLLRDGRRPRLAIVPTGTANDLAAGLGLPDDVTACLDIALQGAPVPMDIATVNGHAFLNVSVGGMGAEATRDASSGQKRFLGAVAYLVHGVRAIADAEPIAGRFKVDGKLVYDDGFLFFAVGNGRLTGGGTEITPEAEIADGRLDLIVLRAIPKVELVRLLPAIRAGDHVDDPAVFYRQATRIEITTEAGVVVNVDGEPITESRRLRYRDTRQRVEVMAPARGPAAA